jgi:hypothetical protein
MPPGARRYIMTDRDERTLRHKAAHPQAATEDALSPAKVVRDREEERYTERLGNTTPVGPPTSPPVDPDAV